MRSAAIYLAALTCAAFAVLAALHWSPAPAGDAPETSLAAASAAASPLDGLRANLGTPLARLLVQMVVVLTAARLAGALFARVKLPAVAGEMAAGLLLGPSLLGHLAPGVFAFVFPASSLGALQLLSQVGVCLFMFTVGMEIDAAQLRRRIPAAVAVSHASIAAPFALGLLLAWPLFQGFAGPEASFASFALFLGVSMSITAFPVLARILDERGMSGAPLGRLVITCAAVDDVTAWTIMAFVIAAAGAAGVVSAGLTLGLLVLFVAAMILVVRPLLPHWVGQAALAEPEPSRRTLALVLSAALAAALATEVIGIHALFGAFLAGAVTPRAEGFRERIAPRVERLVSVLLLPLFFAFTGLRTRIDLLADPAAWAICLLIVAAATAGKLGGAALAARISGLGWREALQAGALMNTRGLMELIALDIGYDMGILGPRIFTMLVIMALVTTLMTGPLLTLFGGSREKAAGAA